MPRISPVLFLGFLTAAANAQGCALRSHPFMAFEVQREATWKPDSNVQWVPGSSGARSGASTTVELVVQFVVDSAGSVVPSTIHTLTPVATAHLREIRADVARWHFEPATVSGCKVSQLVQLSVVNGR